MGLNMSGGGLMISVDGVKRDGVEDQWEKISRGGVRCVSLVYVLLLMNIYVQSNSLLANFSLIVCVFFSCGNPLFYYYHNMPLHTADCM